MKTWNDFIALFDGLIDELEKLDKALERMKEYYCKVNESPKKKEICPHTTNPLQLRSLCKRCRKEDRLLTKEDLDRIDLKNAESNFLDALYDVSREQDSKTVSKVVEWIKSHQLIEPDRDSITRFEPFYQIEQAKLKEIG